MVWRVNKCLVWCVSSPDPFGCQLAGWIRRDRTGASWHRPRVKLLSRVPGRIHAQMTRFPVFSGIAEQCAECSVAKVSFVAFTLLFYSASTDLSVINAVCVPDAHLNSREFNTKSGRRWVSFPGAEAAGSSHSPRDYPRTAGRTSHISHLLRERGRECERVPRF